jgi:cell wall-associated NlpC family hydrolase
MKQLQPRGLNRRRVEQLLSKTKHLASIGDKIDALSRHFVGHPYTQFPLIGSAETAEVFVTSLEGFDCVTFIETILALARASNVDDFAAELRKIRYEKGRVEWRRRNHYMTGWIRNNARDGIVKPLSTRAIPTVIRGRTLNVVPGLRARRTSVRSVPKRAMPRLESHLQTGDLIFFASTRRHLDVFHCGIVARGGNGLLLRHAALSRGGVVEQPLREFLKANSMAGTIVARPQG